MTDPEIKQLLSLTDPPAAADVDAAWARFRARSVAAAAPVHHRRPVWLAGAAVAVLVGVLGFSPAARSATVQVLLLFRVSHITALPVSTSSSVPINNRAIASRIGQFLSSEVSVRLNEPSQPGAAAAAASWSGFTPLYASEWDGSSPAFQFRGAKSFSLTLDRDRAQAILDASGVVAPPLPSSLNGALISVHLPRALMVMYGDCSAWAQRALHDNLPSPPETGNCTVLGEGPSPEVHLPAGLDMRGIADVGLQMLGMSPAAARQYTNTVDWSSTLVVPFPAGQVSSTQVQVNGAQGVLFAGSRPRPGYVLLWSRQGMIYSIVGPGNGSQGLTLAAQLQPQP
ncbi:MAG: hypothetical protein ACRD1Y_14305 [Terriglobales bacterium]